MTLTIFLKTCCGGSCTGISIVDSTPIRVYKSKHIKANTTSWPYKFEKINSGTDQGDFSSNRVTSLFQDKKGYIWFVTAGEGLNRLNPITGVTNQLSINEKGIGRIIYSMSASTIKKGKFLIGSNLGN